MSILAALRTLLRTRRPVYHVAPQEKALSLRPTVYWPSTGADRVRDRSTKLLQVRNGAHARTGGAPLCCA